MSGLLEALRAGLPEQYRVEVEIGRGGMATVFAAEDLKHGRRVAIKVLTSELSTSLGADRFLREIQLSARLSHPNILPVFDSGEANRLLYYVMPFVEGESLRARMRREQQLSIADAITLTCEVADALSYAHAMGVVHRDIKPENVLMHGGHAVVSDFGIARMLYEADDRKLTGTGVSLGTAAYMSPEQFAGTEVDGRSDQYSLACVLYEMLVGQVPFTGPNSMAIMARHTMEAVPSVRVVRATVPDELEAVIMRALEKVPADRFATMQQFRDAVIDGAAGSSFAPRTTRYTMSREAVKDRRSGSWLGVSRGWALTVGGIFLVTLLGAATQWFLGAPKPTVDVEALRRVAVLYFDDASRGGELAFLADGLTESIIDALGGVSGLSVVSRNGVRALRGSTLPVARVGDSLKVGAVVRGSVEPTSNGVHVAVQLFDAESGARLERRGFDVATRDLGAFRARLTEQVTDFLRRQLGEQLRLEAERRATTDDEAWLLTQRAERRRKDADSLAGAGETAGAARAVLVADSLLSIAERRDRSWPEPAARRAGLSLQQARLLRAKPLEAGAAIDSGITRADRALALDPRDADALEVRGQLLYLRYSLHLIADFTAAEATLDRAQGDLERAVAANPGQAGAWSTLSSLYYRRQNLAQANVAARSAYRADAYAANTELILTRLFWTSHDLGSFADARNWCTEGHARFPASAFFVECELWLRLTKLYDAPDVAEAWRLVDSIRVRTSASSWPLDGRRARILAAGVLVKGGLPDSARAVLRQARAGADVDPRHTLMGFEAVIRVMLHEYDEAVSLIETYLTANPEHRKGFATNTAWWWSDPRLQSNPRFRTLISAGRS